MMNAIFLVGRLTKTPELKHTQGGGVAYVRFTLAVNRPIPNQNGEKSADFINCIAWRLTAESLAKYQTKGSLIGVEGRIKSDSFDGQDGKRVFMTEVVAQSIQFLETRANNSKEQGNGTSQQQQPNNTGYQQQHQPPQYQQTQYQQQQPQYQQQQHTYAGQQNHGYQQSYQQSAEGNSYGNPNNNGYSYDASDDDLPF